MGDKLNNIDPEWPPVSYAEEHDPSYQSGEAGRGLFCEEILEPLPQRINALGDTVTKNGNAWIVLGRDRPGSRSSGYGGSGATQASAIDLCVGMGTGKANEYVDPNFKGDAARIYISQRCDIDNAFKIKPAVPEWGSMDAGTATGKSDIGYPENQSAIGIKADSVRVIGTNGIKLITRPQNQGTRGGPAGFAGIELIAGNSEKELQYMVRGDNLVDCLTALEERIAKVMSLVFNFLTAQMEANTALASHIHTGTGMGANLGGPVLSTVTVFPSPNGAPGCLNAIMNEAEGIMDDFSERANLNINWHQRYLSQMSSKYILSNYNKVN
jgi:hypothetical protein